MDPRYWKEFEKLDDICSAGKRSGSEEMSPRYPNEKRRKRTRSRSRSSSSSSSGSSSRSSSSSSRRHSDSHHSESHRSYKRDAYRRNSPSRGSVRESGFRGREDGNWFPQPPPQQYPPQSQDLPPSSSYPLQGPGQFPQGLPPGQYPPNFQGQNFGNNYHSYGGYEPPPSNYYPPNFPPHSGSQPPPHNYPMGRGPPGAPGPGPGPGHPPRNWDMFPDTMLPPPIIQQPVPADGLPGPPVTGLDKKAEEAAKKEAIEQELIQQKRTLSKQREDYVKRKFSLNRELSRLKDQKRELLKEKSKENERILRENAKLQGEILQKLKSIDNVIEMLTNIIGDGTQLPNIIKEIKQMEKEKTEEKVKKCDKKKHSPEKSEGRKGNESSEKEDAGGDRDNQGAKNYIYYDPGLHWCADCNVFPKTVSEYLDHLHSQQHKVNAKMKLEDYPWHNHQNLEEKSPQLSKDMPSKRIPIRGVQFLIPATAWYCSMCKVWLGDSHCALKHVQNIQHSHTYNEFISKNPDWEVDWLTERTKSYERKSEANRHTNPVLPTSSTAALDSLSNQLLAMIASTKESTRGTAPAEATPPPPPPPPITKSSSSSSSDDDSPDIKSSKKRKKSKKNKAKERSPSKEKVTQTIDQIRLSYKTMPDRKVDSIPVDDSFIKEWMPRVEKRDLVPFKKKSKEDIEYKQPKKGRGTSGSREPSSDVDKRPSPYENVYNDHDESIIFDKRIPSSERDSRNKRKNEDDLRYDRHSKYDRLSPKDKQRYKSFEKHKPDKEEKYDDYRTKKDLKHPKEISERDRIKKSPFSRMKDSIEKKKSKNKLEKTSDEDTHETAFEKRSSESAAKKKDGKKVVLNTLPKTKLPFIGRMPILKKKVEQKPDDKEMGKKDNAEEDAKDAVDSLIPSESLVESKTQASEPIIDELPKSTLIISKRPRLPEPGIVKKEILFDKPVNDNLTEQDMELDDESGIMKEEEPPKDELHKDFKEALDLLFPEEKKDEDTPETKEDPEVIMDEQGTVTLPPPGYMLPPGYDVSMYPQYYDQQAYVQQWAHMGYEQAAQYSGAYSYPPPPIEQQTVIEAPPQPVSEVEQQPEPKKKKKNAPSQRMRRHLMKKKALEAFKEPAEGSAETVEDMDAMGMEEDFTADEEVVENGNDDMAGISETEHPKPSDMSDLAMLGIDEDDAAAMGFY